MPKIETSEKLFYGLIGKTYTDEQLVDILPVAKAELDEHDVENHVLKLELNDTNRPDLWSAAGLARAIRTYETGKIPSYDFFSTKDNEKDSEGRMVIDDPSALGIRDYSIGFAARGKKVDEETLLTLIQSQEKLCWNYGRKRKTVALGIYRSDLIKYPVHYAAVDPDKTRFVPLGMEEELSLREICAKHPKGKEYGHIVSDKPLFPYLYDDNGDTLSFPPVINSARIGAVEVGDENLFVELSGPILDNLLLVAAILACDMADLGFEILPVKVKFARDTEFGREITVPYYYQVPQECELAYASKILGVEFDAKTAEKALARMGVESKADDRKVTIRCPEYRNDFLHAVDVMEDLMVGYGLGNFAPIMPNDFTVGRLSPVEEFSRKVKDVMVGLGYQEMMYNYLGSKKEYVDNMNIKGDECVFIANPMSENFEVVRPSVFPSLLESESVSGHAVYPHKIFEVGKVCFKDESDNSGTTTRDYLGFLCSDTQVGYNEASSYIQTLMYYLRKEYKLAAAEGDTRFIPGRAAEIIVDGRKVGVFGEVHPQVLTNWGCTMPAIMAELDLDMLLSLA
jgi:phenylalanyl-tRNA synthetase, beta subunit